MEFKKIEETIMPALDDIQPVYIKPPSYLQDILKSSDNIYLVYYKPTKICNTEVTLTPKLEASDIGLDLTGNPLPVDLSSDISVIPLEENLWSHEDNYHYPFPLNTARRIINKLLRQSNKPAGINSYIYCVCDGSDKRCCLILGAHQSDSYLGCTEIYHKGCFHQKDHAISFEKMKEQHLSNAGLINGQINSVIEATYVTNGSNLRNCIICDNLPYSACILYNVSWNSYQYEVPEYVHSAEMTMQTIIGHRESEMRGLWEQLSLLRVYSAILTKQPTDLEKITLSDNPKSYIEVCDNITCLLAEIQGVRKTICKKKITENLDINNLRQHDLIDRLWNIMIECSNVADLKNCFHILFEELAMKELFKPIISNENQSSIAAIINEVSSGKLAVPTLSLTQALHFLIESGIEKLKKDYSYILNYFACLNYEKFENYWSKAIGEYTVNVEVSCNNRLTQQDSDKVTARKIRLTTQAVTSLINTSERIRKLNCLLKLHIACNFLILGSRARLSTEESFTALVESVKDYIQKHDNTSSKNSSECIMEEIKVKLRSNDVKFLHGKDPVTWTVKLMSTCGRSTVTTTFHHSLKPLFPPCIFNKYDIPVVDDGSIYYVTEMVNSIEKV